MDNKNITELAVEAQKGDKASLDELTRKMYPRAYYLARSYSNKIVGGECLIDDYANEAILGMIESLGSYDAQKGEFYYYADYAMRQSIRDYLDNYQRIIKQPKNASYLVSRLNKAIRYFEEIGVDNPSDKDLMEYTGFSQRVLNNAKDHSKRQYVYSLDYEYGDDEDRSVTIADAFKSNQNLQLDVELRAMQDSLEKEIMNLKEDDRLLLFSFFGAYGYKRESARTLSSKLGISSTTINNRRHDIIDRIRTNICAS